MIEPKQETFYVMEMSRYNGDDSLDAIATDHYGMNYQGQQTGEMMSNYSWHRYEFPSEPEVLERLEHWSEKMLEPSEFRKTWTQLLEEYNGYPPEFCHPISYPEDREHSGGWGWIKLWKEFVAKNGDDYESERFAPEPDVILADLIYKGILPYGNYLLHVYW